MLFMSVLLLCYPGTCEASSFDSIRKGLADSKIFESNRPCLLLALARRKLSQPTQTINDTQWYGIQTR